MATGLVVYTLTSTLLVALGLPLMRRRIGPNGLYGLRIRETLADEQVWYEANARSGRDMVAVGLVGLGLSIGLYLAPGVGEGAYHRVMIGFLLAAVVLGFVRDLRFAKRLAARRRAEG